MSVTITMTTCIEDLRLAAMYACDNISKSQLQEQFFRLKEEAGDFDYATIDSAFSIFFEDLLQF